jgi:serine/threonine-protein kinase
MDVDSGSPVSGPLRRVGRYALFDCVGHGATATVHIGRLIGPAGFSKTVAIKRMHENVGRDPEVAAMFLDEARLSGRIRHPNVVATTDLLALDGETFLVMEYVHGESLSALLETLRGRAERMPTAIAVHVMRDVLLGLAAAHEACDEQGEPLHLVHRDVSPHNIVLGVDGSARVLDFGIAKALGRLQDTHLGQVKGKLCYMAPEQLLGQPFDHRVDIFAAGIVLWEALAGRRLFFADNPGQTVHRIVNEAVPYLAHEACEISPSLARVVAKATARDPHERFASASEFAHQLEHASELVSPRAVGEWLRRTAGERLELRAQRLREIECTPLNPTPSQGLAPVQAPPAEPFRVAIGPDEPTRSDVLEVARLVDAPRPLRPSTPALTQGPTRRSRRTLVAIAGGCALALSLTFALAQKSSGESKQVGTVAPHATREASTDDSLHVVVGPAMAEPMAELPHSEDEAEKPAALPAKKRERRAPRTAKHSRTDSKVGAKAVKPARTRPETPLRAEDLFSRN